MESARIQYSTHGTTLINPVGPLEIFYPLHKNRKGTEFTTSNRNLPEVLNIFKAGWETDTNMPENIRAAAEQELLAREQVASLLKYGAFNSCVVNENLTLMPHQQLGREIARYRDKWGFFYDTRTGKTPLSLSIIWDDLQDNPNHKWLVVCPLILVREAWLADCQKFFPDIKIVNCHNSDAAKRLTQMKEQGQIYVMNSEAFVKYFPMWKELHGIPSGIFVDESSDMKSYKSKFSAAIVTEASLVKRFYLLSGTPAPNGEWEYYMQLKAIDFFSVPQSWTQFKERYFINVSRSPQFEKLQLRSDTRDELFTQIKKYSLYVDKEDVLDTPGRTFYEVELDMPDELKKFYNQLRQHLYIELANEVNITAPSAATKLNKLNQLTSGFILDTQARKENELFGLDNPTWYIFSHYRFEKLFEMLANFDRQNKQVIVWAHYHKEFDIIREVLGERGGYIYGATNYEYKSQAIRDFKSGNLAFLVANPASADKGLTLTNCHINIYFSLSWSYELFKQSTERIYGDRRIQPNHCEYYIFIAKGTIDKLLYRDVLQGKKLASEVILNHLKADEYASKDNHY